VIGGQKSKTSFWPLVTDHWTPLLHFLVRRVLAAAAAELLELQPFRRRFPVLGGRIIPLFAITALQRNNFSGHKHNSWLLALSFQLKPLLVWSGHSCPLACSATN
jgi:hypothetical protein